MGTSRIIAVLVLSLGCGLGAGACTQATETSSNRSQTTAAEGDTSEASDDGDIAVAEDALGEFGAGSIGGSDFGHLDLGGPVQLGGSSGPGSGWGSGNGSAVCLATRGECLDAGRRGPEARENFCRSLPDPPRASCWPRVHSRIEWDIWCAITFPA